MGNIQDTATMPVSKKMKVQREHRKAEAAGTRAPVKANGLPVKAPKPTSLCANCRKEIVNTNLKQLEFTPRRMTRSCGPRRSAGRISSREMLRSLIRYLERGLDTGLGRDSEGWALEVVFAALHWVGRDTWALFCFYGLGYAA